MTFLLDTNVISETSRPRPRLGVLSWLASVPDVTLHVAAMSLGELERGIAALPDGRRRDGLVGWYQSEFGPPKLFEGRILPFDARAASVWASLMTAGDKAGRPRSPIDMIIAATAIANGLTVVTLNERDFSGLPIFVPGHG